MRIDIQNTVRLLSTIAAAMGLFLLPGQVFASGQRYEVEFETPVDQSDIYEFFNLEVRGDKVSFVTSFGTIDVDRDDGVAFSLGDGEVCNTYRFGTGKTYGSDDPIKSETACASVGETDAGYTVELITTTHADDTTCDLYRSPGNDCRMVHIEATIVRNGEECTATGLVGEHLRVDNGAWQNHTVEAQGSCILSELD